LQILNEPIELENPTGATILNLTQGENQFVPIPSPVAGLVTRSEASASYGNLIEILANNGFTWLLGNLDNRQVSAGARVAKGQTIGDQGATGVTQNNSPQLHIEISHPQHGAGNPFNRVSDRSITGPLIQEYIRFVSGN
jgi:murein DD-endopeptidase MepM/ murein hydrolase activator NlpD